MNLLENITVLDISSDPAGARCAMALGDMGARVIRMDPPGASSVSDAGTDDLFNRNKERMYINLTDEGHKKIFLAMAARADIVVESFLPGVLDTYGCGYEALHGQNPRLILVSLTAYGQTGPLRDSIATDDAAIQALSGSMSVTGETAGTPLRVGYALSDYLGSMYACAGAVTALLQALDTGEGCHVDVARLDSLVRAMEQPFTQYHITGNPPIRRGNQHATCVPLGDYRTRDNRSILLNISNDEQFAKLCHILHHEEILETDLRYKLVRGENRETVNQYLSDWVSEWDAEELSERLMEEKLAFGEANTLSQLLTHPQVCARNMIGRVSAGDGKQYLTACRPYVLNGTENPQTFVLHTPGEDSGALLKEFVPGMDPADGYRQNRNRDGYYGDDI